MRTNGIRRALVLQKVRARLALGLLLTGGFVVIGDAGEPDWERERRLSNQAEETLFDGEVTTLSALNRDYLALRLTPDGDVHGRVLILHGRGLHPNWPQVVNPLRLGLAEVGWQTVAIQLPVLGKDAKYYDYVEIFDQGAARIEATVGALRDEADMPIVLLAHSCGVHMAMEWIAQGGSGIDAFIGLGMGATDRGQPLRSPLPLARISKPILDVYGEDDYPAVLREAPNRWRVLRSNSKLSQQSMVPGADHDYSEQGDALVDLVSRWLTKIFHDASN